MSPADASARARSRPFWQATRTPEHDRGPVAAWGTIARGAVQPMAWAFAGVGFAAGYGFEQLVGTGTFLWWGAMLIWFGAGLPLLMSALVASACFALLVALAPVAWIAACCSGRPSGYRALSTELRSLAWGILPRYLRALRRVQRPYAWSIALGATAWWCGRSLWLWA